MKKYIVLITVSIFYLSGCRKYEYDFSSGLKAVDLSSNNYTIASSNDEIVIYPRIQKFCKIDNFVIGYRVDPLGDNSDGGDEFTKNLGYFELNISSKKVIRNEAYGLNEVEKKCGHHLRPIF